MNGSIAGGIVLALIGLGVILANRVFGGVVRIMAGDKWAARSGFSTRPKASHMPPILVGAFFMTVGYVVILMGLFGK